MNDQGIILKVDKLSKHFGGLKAVDNVSFTLREGDILGLLGPNGAGKTTCFNVISGIYKPTAGNIFFKNMRADGLAPHEMAGLGVGRTFQIVKPFPGMSVLDNIITAIGIKDYPYLVKSLMPWNTSSSRDRATEILGQVGLGHLAMQKAGTLPLGDLRRLEIGRSLALEPSLLLLDESFSGLRHEKITLMEELILSLAGKGISVLLIEHNMRVAMKLCDRVVVLDHGRMLSEGTPEEIGKDPAVIEAYLGKGGTGHAS